VGAPTWPPTPEESARLFVEEYGEEARRIMGLDSDEEAEQAILAHFLFAPPRRELVSGEEVGTPLDSLLRSLTAWLRAVSDGDVQISTSDPASTDGEVLFLPRAAPAPVQPAEDALLFRVMALVQVGFLKFGLLDNRRFVAELHRDWVLRSCYTLLCVHHIAARWSAEWPGIKADFAAVRFLDKAGAMRVNTMEVPRKGMPGAFLPLSAFNSFFPTMVQGRGWVCIALVVFAMWRPWRALLGALLFALFDAYQLRLQARLDNDIPYQIFLMMPYLFSIAALVIMARRARVPQALMQPYRRGER